ncbi:TetR/AcrR family transcriptional regulator [Gordonia asplenii]|uniref:TetR/AcrR family transcriptional regulator n=1 Tax=Gordonia asplenii TaxID=2725283 RepID=UPI0028A7A076|nr:helix-turn-helix domain-containing protein [Gordonia asplenii]
MAGARSEQTVQTRQRLLRAAEELFAEHGIAGVSNRQVSEAAGQGNNFAVGYHFGSKLDLVRALLTQHQEAIDVIRSRMVDQLGYIAEFRHWVNCLVRPQFEYIDRLGSDSYFARFCAQASVEPTTLQLVYDTAAASRPMLTTLDGMYRTLPTLPAAAIEVRNTMTRHAIVHTLADFEGALAAEAVGQTDWSSYSDGVTDALVGLWLAPAT